MSKLSIAAVALLAGLCLFAVVVGLAPRGAAIYRTNLLKPSANFSDVYPRGRVAVTATGVELLAEPVYVDVRVPRSMDAVAVCLTGIQRAAITLGIRRQGGAWNYETVPYVVPQKEDEQCFQTFSMSTAVLEDGRLRLLISAPVTAGKIELTNATVHFTGQPLSLALVLHKLNTTLTVIKSALW